VHSTAGDFAVETTAPTGLCLLRRNNLFCTEKYAAKRYEGNMVKFLRNCNSLFLWALAYYLIAVASLEFDDPQSQEAVIWFPGGIAVAAFLSSRRKRWPLLFVALATAKVLLSNHSDDGAWRVLFSAAFEISGAFVIAGLVRCLTRRGDKLHEIIVWIVATIIICAIWVLLRKAGVEITEDDLHQNTFWGLWGSLVNGIFFATVIVMGLVAPKPTATPISNHYTLFGGLWLLLLGLITWYVFSGQSLWLVSFGDSDSGAIIYFMLAFLPLVLTSVVTVVAGPRMSSLALLVVGIIVVGYTDQRIGPFYLDNLLHGEPLVLAQSYLSIVALLVAVIGASVRELPKPDPQSTPMTGAAYQLNLASGDILWDEHAHLRLGVSKHSLISQMELLKHVHPDDHEQLKFHWYRDRPMGQSACVVLRIRQDNGGWLSIQDMSPGIFLSAGKRIRVGVWRAL